MEDTVVSTQSMSVFAYICHHKATHDGNSPSCRQIADAMGYAGPSPAHYHVRKLEDYGWISVVDGTIEVNGGRWIAPQKMKV